MEDNIEMFPLKESVFMYIRMMFVKDFSNKVDDGFEQ